MPLDLTGVKLTRAEEHLNLIRERASELVYTTLDFMGTEESDATEQWEVYVWSDAVRQPDPMWGVYLGDFAHNARSALDQLIWLLVLANGATPAVHNQFPICKTAREWKTEVTERDTAKRGPSPTAGVSSEALSVIHGAQPYLVSGRQRDDHPFLRLQRISNADKHRTLHVASIATTGGIQVRYVPDGYIKTLKYRQGPGAQKVEGGLEIGRSKIGWIQEPPPGVNLQVGLDGVAQIAFSAPDVGQVGVMLDMAKILAASRLLVQQVAKHADPT